MEDLLLTNILKDMNGKFEYESYKLECVHLA